MYIALTFPPKSPSHGVHTCLLAIHWLGGGGSLAGYVGYSNEAAAGRTEGENKEAEGGMQRGPALLSRGELPCCGESPMNCDVRTSHRREDLAGEDLCDSRCLRHCSDNEDLYMYFLY